ncbi:MAG TPA: S9 family peptidase [Terriglobales bacterium]|nr:S9 family peptidase [Terriglobales bacterium]
MLYKLTAFVLLLSSLCLGQLLTSPKAETDPQNVIAKMNANLSVYSLDKFFMTGQIGGSSWSPDGKRIAVVTNLAGRMNIWVAPSDGGWPQQLTISDQRQSHPAWSPNGQWIAYQSDYDGNEYWDLFLVSPANGEVVQLTRTPEISEEQPTWSPTGKDLAYVTRPKTSPSYEIAVLNVLSRKSRNLTTNTPADVSNTDPLWSPDGKSIAYTQENASGHNSNVFVVDVESGKSVNLTSHEGEKRYAATGWSPDGKTLLITSNAANGFENVALLDVATKKLNWLTHEKWDLQSGQFSPSGKEISFQANVDGNVDVYLYNLLTHKAAKLQLPVGVNVLAGSATAFSKDGLHILYSHSGPTAAEDLWVYSPATRRSKQVTHSMSAAINPNDMVTPYLVHYPSRDGKFTISAWAYMPYNIGRNDKYPAIIYIHGGPASQQRNDFNPFLQYMMNQGYVVIAPNYRGSSGYGEAFERANLMDMGGGDLQDVLAAADFIRKTGYVDPKKLIVMGRSYGGYMTMMAVTKDPEKWAAGAAVVPFVNWFTEYQNEDATLQASDKATMGDPVKDKALWEDRSPINFVDKIKAPLLLIAGANDPRCPKSEAEQVAAAIKKNGGTVQLKIYEDEGHAFGKREDVIDHFKRISDFLKVQVPSPGCGCELME